MGKHEREPGGWWSENWGYVAGGAALIAAPVMHHYGLYPSWTLHFTP